MATKLDTDSILNDATEKLEKRFSEIQGELEAIEATKAPLKAEQKTLAEAINRLVGSYPSGYNGAAPTPRATRSAGGARLSDEEKAAKITEVVNAAGADGITNKDVAEKVGLSPATAAKTIDALLGTGTIVTNGKQKAARRLLADG